VDANRLQTRSPVMAIRPPYITGSLPFLQFLLRPLEQVLLRRRRAARAHCSRRRLARPPQQDPLGFRRGRVFPHEGERVREARHVSHAFRFARSEQRFRVY